MKITEFSVRNFPFTIVVFLALAALGASSFFQMPRSEDPPLHVPAYNVVVLRPGASPTDMERLIARPLEDRLKELDDIHKLRSTIRDGLAIVQIEFFYGQDPDRKYDDVLRQVNVERALLPADVVSVEVVRVQTLNVALLQAALVSPDANYARLQDLAETLRKRFEAVPGVRRAERHAFPAKQVQVALDLDRVTQLRLPLGGILGAIQGDNTNLPAGAVEAGGRRFALKTSGSYTSLAEVRQTPVAHQGDAVVRLGDIADVHWAYEEQEVIGRFNGERAVFVTALPREAINIFTVREALGRALDTMRAELPADVRLEVGFDQAVNVRARLARLQADFLFAFGLVLVTVLPLGLRAAGLVMISIPLSLAMGLTLLYLTGYGLNQLSIVGCVIALGLLVDDSVVVVENIARFRRHGASPWDAAIQGTRQIAVAVAGTTAALLFAFLPLLLLPGGAGQFIRSMPLAVVYTVAASMVVALTIIPFLASRLFAGAMPREGNALLRWLQRAIHTTYRPLLHAAMQHRRTTLIVAGLLVAGSLALVKPIGFSLFPTAGIPEFLIKIEAEEGASVARVDALARAVEARLRDRPEIAWFYTTVGKGNPQVYYNEVPLGQKANTAEIFASLAHYDAATSAGVLDTLRADLGALPGATIVVKEFEQGPPIEAPIAVRVFSDDLAQLALLAARVEDVVRGVEGTLAVTNPLRTARTDLRVRVDKDAAALLGVAEAEIDRAVRLALAGLPAGRFREADGDEYNLTLTLPRGDRATLAHWDRLQVPTLAGAWVPLAQVAALELESAPPEIKRYQGERSATVSAQVATDFNVARLTGQIADQLAALEWPVGTRWSFGGQVESQAESFGGMGTAVVIALAGILGVLVLEFGSFRGTLVVASVIPLGLVGGLAGLFLTGYTLSFTAAVGFVALVGIEIKNSILLVDFTNQLRARGLPLREAIEQAGEIRFLPVVLTTATAIGALLPLAWQGSGLYSPLAVVIIGGLVSSLLLSRVVTPVLYSLLPPPMRTEPAPLTATTGPVPEREAAGVALATNGPEALTKTPWN